MFSSTLTLLFNCHFFHSYLFFLKVKLCLKRGKGERERERGSRKKARDGCALAFLLLTPVFKAGGEAAFHSCVHGSRSPGIIKNCLNIKTASSHCNWRPATFSLDMPHHPQSKTNIFKRQVIRRWEVGLQFDIWEEVGERRGSCNGDWQHQGHAWARQVFFLLGSPWSFSRSYSRTAQPGSYEPLTQWHPVRHYTQQFYGLCSEPIFLTMDCCTVIFFSPLKPNSLSRKGDGDEIFNPNLQRH